MMSSLLEASSSRATSRTKRERKKEKKKQKKRPGKGALAALGVTSATGGRAMIAAAFPTETAASQCPRTKPRPALPGDLEACRLRGPIARPRVWTPGTASSKQGGLHRQSSRIKV
ncbi:uncharacterized protein LOC134480486 isoform X2 [Rattus norvegicus]|uniref:uncharacterized protein LOC134480486 isoform X2 n=1 Tax=Rattus norvegicus TaxID=10116 RepID=UPI002FD7AAB5